MTDQLPRNTAIGYIDHEDGTWNTNIFSIPIKGGADGGAYTTAPDVIRFWDGLLTYQLLNESTTQRLITPHVHEEGETYYGRGVWVDLKMKGYSKYMSWDLILACRLCLRYILNMRRNWSFSPIRSQVRIR